MSAQRAPIRPDTKVGRLLDDWPELEAVLLELSPKFAKLRNPILRKTVARVATLAAAAKMGDLEPMALVAVLREAAGLAPLADGAGDGPGSTVEVEGEVVETLDADALLERGANPLAEVRRRVGTLGAGEVLEVRSSFRPEPLLESLAKIGAPARTEEAAEGDYVTRIARPAT